MISIIIPTYNKALRLKFCLKHLMSCQTQYKMEIIIINDGSQDKTKDVLQSMIKGCTKNIVVKVLDTSNKGRAAARNLGVENAIYDIILFLDDDIIVDKRVIDMHIKSHQLIENRIVHGKICHVPYMKIFNDLEKNPASSGFLREKYDEIALRFSDPIDEDLVRLNKYAKDADFERFVQQAVLENQEFKWTGFVGANTSIRKKLFRCAGGFDCNFGKNWGCEDLEFGYRLNRFYNVEFIYDILTKSYHLDHYDTNRRHQHQQNMKYFKEKYNDDMHIDELNSFLSEIM